MRKLLIISCLFFALASLAFGQGVNAGPFTALKTVNGLTTPIANATVTVCAASTGGIPCSPALVNAIFQDVALTQPLSNPFTADANGNYSFAIAAGNYTVTVTAAGFGGYSSQITVGVGGSPIAPVAQIGDCLRFNVNGSNTYNGVNCATNFESVFSMQGTVAPNALGAFGNNGLSQLGSGVNFPATATQGGAITYSSAATASTNTLIGVRVGNNGNNSIGPFLAFYKYSLKLQLNALSSVRYWIGLGCWNTVSGLGNNNVQILATTAYASDTPNKTTIAFRFSAGTDTHWQAVTAVAGGSQTTVDTGVTPDTNVHLFEFAPNAAGTSITFFIDGASVATISTNLPPMGLASDSMATMFWTGDNKNTNTSVSANFFWMQESMK